MGTIIKKKIKDTNYYYYVESKRVNGKPKYVNQKYLGSAEKILAMAADSGKSLQDRVLYAHEVSFGSVALLFEIAKRLGVVDIIDSIMPKRKQGVSVGMYILIAAINRAVSPTSTNGLEDWYSKTALPYITGFGPSSFTAQNFWNNTDITEDQLHEIEDKILEKSISVFGIETSRLIYDATNFFTYIDTMNPSELAKRGHDKAKRNDLKTIGLALTVIPDFAIPILSEVYPGNRNDSNQFSETMNSFKTRFRNIVGKEADITLVFDRGNNSAGNLDILEDENLHFHYVGGLKKDQVPELFNAPKENYHPLNCPEGVSEKYQNLKVYRMKATVFSRAVTTVIVYNPLLEQGQLQGIRINMEKTSSALMEIQEKLLRRYRGEITKGKKPTTESVIKNVENVLSKREYMNEIFTYEIIDKEGSILLTFSASESALQRIKEKELGKTALFTDRHELTDYQIISAYRSAWNVESAFKQMKDTDFLTVRPLFHWTDSKIRVHLFVCVLAYRLCALLRKELHEHGIDCSIDQYLQSMGAVKRVTTFYSFVDKVQKIEAFTQSDELAEKIENVYELQKKYYR